jgi:hypothetical protein
MKRHIPELVALIGLTLAAGSPAWAMTLSYTTTVDDSRNLTRGTGTVTHEPNPGSDGFTHTFTEPTQCCVLSGSGSSGFGFYDDFVFDVTAGTVASIVTTLNTQTSQITNLQERIYAVDSREADNAVPVLGTPEGVTLQGWTSISPNGSVVTFTDGLLAGGRYSLQIRGNVTGSSGGTYSGSVNFSPVPVPPALPLLLSGFGVLALLSRPGRTAIATT